MKAQIYILLLIISSATYGQQYNAASIPDSMLKYARIVKRIDETVLEIKSSREGTVRRHWVYTILKETGAGYANYARGYNKFNAVNTISGTLYNGMGKEIRRVKKKDLKDEPGSDEETLVTDTRYKTNDFYWKDYPFTVEYEEEYDLNTLMFLPSWMPQGNTHISVEYSKFTVIAPKNYTLRYKPVHISSPPTISESGDKRTYSWEIRNLPARASEELTPNWAEIAPSVMIGSSEFEMEGYKGDMTTWAGFGKFNYELIKGRDVLPADIKTKVHALTDGLSGAREKIAALYNFLQKNTHYVGVQLGIGSWQPFDAGYVATKGYGDCKALSNYMLSLLKEAGITGKYVLIRSGSNASPVPADFPIAQFTHVICCVPLDRDTLWLECTSQNLPAGYLSSFTADRFGLLVDENGGKLVRTPKYGLKENIQIRRINAIVDPEGHLSAIIQAHYAGLQQDDLEGLIDYSSKENVMKYLKTQISLPTYDVSSFNYQEEKTTIPSIEERLEINASNYAQTSGKRLFIKPNILNKSDTKLESIENRKNDFELRTEYRDIDTVELKIPPGYELESAPKDVSIQTKFGRYISSVKFSADKLLYYRINEGYSGEFPANDYSAAVKYYDDIFRADQSQVVLVKKN